MCRKLSFHIILPKETFPGWAGDSAPGRIIITTQRPNLRMVSVKSESFTFILLIKYSPENLDYCFHKRGFHLQMSDLQNSKTIPLQKETIRIWK